MPDTIHVLSLRQVEIQFSDRGSTSLLYGIRQSASSRDSILGQNQFKSIVFAEVCFQQKLVLRIEGDEGLKKGTRSASSRNSLFGYRAWKVCVKQKFIVRIEYPPKIEGEYVSAISRNLISTKETLVLSSKKGKSALQQKFVLRIELIHGVHRTLASLRKLKLSLRIEPSVYWASFGKVCYKQKFRVRIETFDSGGISIRVCVKQKFVLRIESILPLRTESCLL